MKKKRGSEEAIKQIIAMGKRISIDEMAAAEKAAVSAGGRLSSVAFADDDWCGTGKFKFPFPFPEPKRFLKFFDYLVASRLNCEILINGIPVPEEIIVGVSRSIGR